MSRGEGCTGTRTPLPRCPGGARAVTDIMDQLFSCFCPPVRFRSPYTFRITTCQMDGGKNELFDRFRGSNQLINFLIVTKCQ